MHIYRHIYGSNDKIVKPKHSEAVVDRFSPSLRTVIEHNHMGSSGTGHLIPDDESTRQGFKDFIELQSGLLGYQQINLIHYYSSDT